MAREAKIEAHCTWDQKAEIETEAKYLGMSISTFLVTMALQAVRTARALRAAGKE